MTFLINRRRTARHDVVFLGLQALDAGLGLLLLQDDEGPAILVEDHGHGCGVRPLRDGFFVYWMSILLRRRPLMQRKLGAPVCC